MASLLHSEETASWIAQPRTTWLLARSRRHHDPSFNTTYCFPNAIAHRGTEAKWDHMLADGENTVPRLVYCTFLMLIEADRACRSGLELVSAFCHHRLDVHGGLARARNTSLVVLHDPGLCKRARRRASTCDEPSSHTL